MTLFVAFLLISILFPFFFIVALFLTKKKEFSFRSYFLYEFFAGREKDASYYLIRIMSALAFLAPSLSGVYGLTLVMNGRDANSIVFFCAVLLAALAFALSSFRLEYVDMSNEKEHLSLFFASIIGVLIFSGMCGFYFVAVYRNLYISSLLALAPLLFLISLSSVILILNPKIRDWSKLEKKKNDDGSVSYARPKRFVLPYSEWLLFFLIMLSNVISLIGLYIISIN